MGEIAKREANFQIKEILIWAKAEDYFIDLILLSNYGLQKKKNSVIIGNC